MVAYLLTTSAVEQSFYTQEWYDEFPGLPTVSAQASFAESAKMLVNRMEVVHAYFKHHFKHVSGVYIGKTSNIKTRFARHTSRKRKHLAQLCIHSFTERDLPALLKNYGANASDLAGFYERRCLELRQERGGALYRKMDAGGGGRVDKKTPRSCMVYMLVSFTL